ncbi:DUF6470 family protein [Neobacillus sp. LXY-1]|uniref:DUF6470 family protein n=1 Tax=Neobacillus sp. LXY-1 TaxID=3379133 RepID=UPI003EE411CA
MNLLQIRLHQTFAQIGMRTIQPVQEIKQVPADLSIKQIPSEMNIERTPSKLVVDQEEAWEQLGFKSLTVLKAEFIENAKQDGLQAIAEIAEKGDQMAAIQNKTDAIVAQAAEKANPQPADFNIAFIPSPGSVKIQFTPAEVHISWKPGGAEINSIQNKPIHNYTPGKTEIYLRQKQGLEIDFVGGNIDNTR